MESISIQTFPDYEIVVTDDSPDDSVGEYLNSGVFHNLRYFRNPSALGTPENWNEAIRKSNGTWIKIMHDDDWFSQPDSLEHFYNASRYQNAQFCFCAFTNVWENGKEEEVRLSSYNEGLLRKNPINLFKFNFIGNPSCTLIRRDDNILYDNSFKWVVDFEYYIRYLRAHPDFHYIDQPLINVGMNEDQVTGYTFRKPNVEIPENLKMGENFGESIFKNIFVYDYYWRLLRNLGIRSQADIQKHYDGVVQKQILAMLNFQRHIPARLLQAGLISKPLMFWNYLFRNAK